MRILVFLQHFGGPTTTFIYKEITQLARHHEVKVVCEFLVNQMDFPVEVEEISISIMPWVQRIKWRLKSWNIYWSEANPRFRKRFNEIVHEFQPDIIHCHFGNESMRVFDNFFRTDIPLFIHFHGYDASAELRFNLYKAKLRRLFERPNVFPILVSSHMHAFMRKQGVEVPEPHILYYGTDTDVFQRKGPAASRPPVVFLQISSFNATKGHAYTLRAFRKLFDAHPELEGQVRVVLAGGSFRIDEMKAECKSLGLDSCVSFPGWVTVDQAYELLSEAHVFIHHSITAVGSGSMEGIPNALMEAMAMELPVLSTWHSGIPELVEDGIHGYLVNEGDVGAYAKRLYDILDWELVPQSREKVKRLFEKEQHYRLLVSYYQQALEVMKCTNLPVSSPTNIAPPNQ